MFHKALWLKEYKQSKFLLWGFMIVSFYLPYDLYKSAMQYQQFVKYNSPTDYYYDSFTSPAIIQFLLVLLIASFMVGWERNNKNMDFSLSLPFSRKAIFFTKWALGIITIFTAVTINIFISIYIVHSTLLVNVKAVRDSVILYDYLTVLLVLIALFTFSLLLGYITGNFGAQFVLSFIFSLLPAGLWYLMTNFLEFNFGLDPSYDFYTINQMLTAVTDQLTLPVYLTNIIGVSHADTQITDFYYLLIPIGITIVCFFLALSLSKKSKAEHTGMILLYQSLQPYLKIGVLVCFFLFGGMMVGNISYGNTGSQQASLVPYYIGAIIFAALAYFILSKLLNMKLSFKRN